ncbi:hypothetical protein ISN44_As01g005710, partial [Arabidopsis suecica]
ILFLMPSHSTPYYSTLHSNIPMQFLDYAPSEEREEFDESGQFLMDLIGFASKLARKWSALPKSHCIVCIRSNKTL